MLGVLTQLLYLLSKPDSPSSQLACDEVCPMDKKVAAVAPLRSANSLPASVCVPRAMRTRVRQMGRISFADIKRVQKYCFFLKYANKSCFFI